jgi:hypothetical protein
MPEAERQKVLEGNQARRPPLTLIPTRAAAPTLRTKRRISFLAILRFPPVLSGAQGRMLALWGFPARYRCSSPFIGGFFPLFSSSLSPP